MSIYYNYAPDGNKIVVLSYVDDFVYRCTSKALGKWFMDTTGKIFYVKFVTKYEVDQKEIAYLD